MRYKNTPNTDLLASAHGTEIHWGAVTPIIKIAKSARVGGPWVYAIGEPDDGPLKIGVAKNPINRLRQLQTGNPRHLTIERLIIGTGHDESYLHALWHSHVIPSSKRRPNSGPNGDIPLETEWFRPEARPEIHKIFSAIAIRHMSILYDWREGIFGDDAIAVRDAFTLAISEIIEEHGLIVMGGDSDQFLAEGGGYVTRKYRLPIITT
jgi:hypothetical protein